MKMNYTFCKAIRHSLAFLFFLAMGFLPVSAVDALFEYPANLNDFTSTLDILVPELLKENMLKIPKIKSG